MRPVRLKPLPRALVPTLVPLLALVGLAVSPPRPARATDLLSEDVACNRTQLAALLGRARIETSPGLPRPTTLFLTYSSRYGFYQGLALDGPWRNREGGYLDLMPEYHLAFSLNPTLRDVLLNPERPLLDQVGLAREESNTTRVPAGSPHLLTLTVDPTLASSMGATPDPAALLAINDLADGAAGRRSSDSKPGRGLALDAITSLCHDRFTARDLEIFTILQRTLRVEAHGPDFDYDTEIALYRGEADDTYVAEVFAVDPSGQTVELDRAGDRDRARRRRTPRPGDGERAPRLPARRPGALLGPRRPVRRLSRTADLPGRGGLRRRRPGGGAPGVQRRSAAGAGGRLGIGRLRSLCSPGPPGTVPTASPPSAATATPTTWRRRPGPLR